MFACVCFCFSREFMCAVDFVLRLPFLQCSVVHVGCASFFVCKFGWNDLLSAEPVSSAFSFSLRFNWPEID